MGKEYAKEERKESESGFLFLRRMAGDEAANAAVSGCRNRSREGRTGRGVARRRRRREAQLIERQRDSRGGERRVRFGEAEGERE